MTKRGDSADYYLGVRKDAFRRYRMFNDVHMPGTANCLAELDMHLLEVGCDIGDTACCLARNIVLDGHVTAFDQAGELVDLAEQEASEAGISNVTFVCSRAQDFDYGSDRFDLAHSRYVLSYSPDSAEIVGRIFGALKPADTYLGEEVAQNLCQARRNRMVGCNGQMVLGPHRERRRQRQLRLRSTSVGYAGGWL